MQIFLGLGNPGRRYARTRHNIGQRWLKDLARHWQASAWEKKEFGEYASVQREQEELILLVLSCYMNTSGECLKRALRFFSVSEGKLWVAHDDLDLPFGVIRFKENGNPAGHKGILSIYEALGGPLPLNRIRFGISRPLSRDAVVSYVLSPFSKEEESLLPSLFSRAREAVELALEKGFTQAQNWLHAQLPPFPSRVR